GADSARMPDLRLTVSVSPAKPLPDGVCDWSEEAFRALVAHIRTEVPPGEIREKSLKSVSTRLDPTVESQQEVEIATAWRNLALHSSSEEAFENARVAAWRGIGCEGDYDSYVLHSMISQFITRGGPSWQVTLARLFLDPVQCPPASHLSGQAMLKLKAMAMRM